jgi:hypothetical protein
MHAPPLPACVHTLTCPLLRPLARFCARRTAMAATRDARRTAPRAHTHPRLAHPPPDARLLQVVGAQTLLSWNADVAQQAIKIFHVVVGEALKRLKGYLVRASAACVCAHAHRRTRRFLPGACPPGGKLRTKPEAA